MHLKLVILLLTALFSFAATSAPAPSPPAESAADQAARRSLDLVINDMNVNGVALSSLFQLVGLQTRTKFTVDWASLEKAGINKDTTLTLAVKNMKISDLLGTVFAQLTQKIPTLKIGYAIKDGTILITAQPPKPVP